MIYSTSDQFILAGDFNLADLTWYNGTCIALTGCRENISMKNIIDTFGLTQYVTVATRNNNILDLLFCNSPNIVDSVTLIPGISDHLAVVATIKHVIKRPKPRQSRKVYFYDKGDYSAISQELFAHLPVFDCHCESADVLQLWSLFKAKVIELTEKYVPSTNVVKLNKCKKPWVTPAIFRLIRKRRRVYKAFKRTHSSYQYPKLVEITK